MKSIHLIFLVLFSLAACKSQKTTIPDRSEIESTEKGSLGFLQKLSTEDRKSYDDLKADWLQHEKGDRAAMVKLYSQAVVQSQTILGRTGYGALFTGVVDTRTREALIQYQKNNGIFQSGNVDPLTYFSLTEDDAVLEDRLVQTASFSFFAKDWSHFFSATGAWDYRNKSSSWIMSSEIDCERNLGTCSEAGASEMTLFGITTLGPSLTSFRVTKWDDSEIRAENDVECEKDQIVIDRDERSVTMHMIATQPDSISCHKLMGDAPVLDAHLKDAKEIGGERREAALKKRRSIIQFSEDARKIVQQ